VSENRAEATITKIDVDKRLVFGWASIIKDENNLILLDRQNDYIDSEEELEKAAYMYALNSRDGGEMHIRKGVSSMVESIVFSKEKQQALGIPEGTMPVGWWIGFKVHDDDVWEQVKKGEYTGFSVHGTGRRAASILKDGEYTDIEKRGEKAGHPFRGNQHTGGIPGDGGGSSDKTSSRSSKPSVARVKTIREAVKRLAQGEAVELESEAEVAIFIDELHKTVQSMAKRGDKAPNYDFCKVTVPGSSLFCAESKGIPRIEMPQFGGTPVKGSQADKLPKNAKGEVDGTQQFEDYLENTLGVKVQRKEVKAASLKASQNELVGAKVAGMINNEKFDPAGEAIFVSRDGYVIDGHHRWAAQIGRDASSGKVGDLPLNVMMVDMPISQVLKVANEWATEFGIAPKMAKGMQQSPPCVGCSDDIDIAVRVSKRFVTLLTKAQEARKDRIAIR